MNFSKSVFILLAFHCLLDIHVSACAEYAGPIEKDIGHKNNSVSRAYEGPILYEDICGVTEMDSFKQRIVGGELAKPHEFPWMVSIQYLVNNIYMHDCGGAVIHPEFILTAAHCMEKEKDKIRIMVGKNNLEETEANEQYRKVKKVFENNYNPENFNRDIAILLLDKPLVFDDVNVKPLCLPRGDESFLDVGIVAGWGKLYENGLSPKELYNVILPIISKQKCKKIYDDMGFEYFITSDEHLCTLAKNKDSCQGDSGGPLMCFNKINSKLYACGLVSWSLGCGRGNIPGIYTDVKLYTEWIINVIEKNKSQ